MVPVVEKTLDAIARAFGAPIVSWPEVIKLMVGGLVTTFSIMILLASITWAMGKILNRKPKAKETGQSKEGQGEGAK